MSFVHLHSHSEYSLVDGIARLERLVERTRDLGMPAVAVTDQANLFGMVKFYRAAVKVGIKPLIGVDAWIDGDGAAGGSPSRLVLLCQNYDGYRLLCRLLTRAYTGNQHQGRACIALDWLGEGTAGLIALSAATDGAVGRAIVAGHADRADTLAARLAGLFPERFYVELQRVGRPQEEEYIAGAVDLAVSRRLPVVATNHVHFVEAAEFEAHEVRVCIHDGRTLDDKRRARRFTEQQFLRSPAEMIALFSDIPEAIENTLVIARRCNLRLSFGRDHLPGFPVAPGTTAEQELRRQAEEGLPRQLAATHGDAAGSDPGRMASYRRRLDAELDVIAGMGFSGYFLIVADFIRWARQNGIPVGPGRGSGAGSLAAFALGITELDPIEHDLLFERFLNPERVSLPDFDIDFCMEGRDSVIGYVADRYGRDRVAQIITHGTMAARAVVRDVGRVLGMPYGQVDRIAKLIPFELKMTLDRALDQEEQLRTVYAEDDNVRALLDVARLLEGIPRNVGTHAGGVVIAPAPLTEYTPLYCEEGSVHTVTQLDKDDIEKIGLVKFDFLGLRTLTIIDRAVKTVNAGRTARGEPPLVMERLDNNDPATYALLRSCRTTALFQLESRGMTEVIQRLQPDCFDDLVALVALYRPGPMRMIDDFVNRKHGRVRSEYLHALLEPILRPTYGIMLYQEQVMQIARDLAGYSLGAADLLRRAMGKKMPEEMAAQRTVFVQGAAARGIGDRLASQIFDLMERFADYGFNRSHSAAYALISYRTAWLKTHYPAAFMAASLSADMDNTDRVVALIAECRNIGLTVLPPDINRCRFAFEPVGPAEILYGLGAVKGIGRSAIDALVEERERAGLYRDLFDLCERVDARRVNRRVLESLIRAGALDALGGGAGERAALMAALPVALDAASQRSEDRSAGQSDLFGVDSGETPVARRVVVPAWSDEERLNGEKATLGLYLTGHPIDRHQHELRMLTGATLAELRPVEDRSVLVAGLVVAMRVMNNRRGERMAFLTLDDRTGRVEIRVFGEVYQRSREAMRQDAVVVVEGPVSADEFTGGFSVRADRVWSLDDARSAFATRVVIELTAAQAANGVIDRVRELLKARAGGPCPLHIRYRCEQAVAEFQAGPGWCILPREEALRALAEVVGRDSLRVVYGVAARNRAAAAETAGTAGAGPAAR